MESYLQDHILRPLDMKDTAFVPTDIRRLASVHVRRADGLLHEVSSSFQVPTVSGSDLLYSTVRDFLTFMQMLLHDGSFMGLQVLSPTMVEFIAKNRPPALLSWRGPDVLEPWDEPRKWSADGLALVGLANTQCWLDPAKRVTGVLFTQLLPFLDARLTGTYRQFARGVYDAFSALEEQGA
ncbi:serine hydrolase domain-containing protein [Bradyrhizobium sp. USDA 4486]